MASRSLQRSRNGRTLPVAFQNNYWYATALLVLDRQAMPQSSPVPPLSNLAIAVLIPCYNEELTVGNVVRGFRAALPNSTIYVYDNNSKDKTVEKALEAGAVVRTERRQGKGNVVRRMFSDIDADVYVMVDGDDTYDASIAPRLIEELVSGPFDIVNVARTATTEKAYRLGHATGNKALTGLVQLFFGHATNDMLSGYKAFTRRYVKSFPVTSRGFEIETELVVHALDLNLPMSELAAPYKDRPEGSESKLSTFADGFRIIRLIGYLVKEERPLFFFSSLAGILAVLSLATAVPVTIDYINTGLVPKLPSAVLSVGLMLSALLSLSCGFILDTVTRGRREIKKLAYLRYPPPAG